MLRKHGSDRVDGVVIWIFNLSLAGLAGLVVVTRKRDEGLCSEGAQCGAGLGNMLMIMLSRSLILVASDLEMEYCGEDFGRLRTLSAGLVPNEEVLRVVDLSLGRCLLEREDKRG